MGKGIFKFRSCLSICFVCCFGLLALNFSRTFILKDNGLAEVKERHETIHQIYKDVGLSGRGGVDNGLSGRHGADHQVYKDREILSSIETQSNIQREQVRYVRTDERTDALNQYKDKEQNQLQSQPQLDGNANPDDETIMNLVSSGGGHTEIKESEDKLKEGTSVPRAKVLPKVYMGNDPDAFPCMNETLLTTNSDFLLTAEEVPLIPGLKNPCFCAGDFAKIEKGIGLRRVGEAERCDLHCLPYFVLAGTEKSGTGDFYGKLTMHQHVFAPVRKETQWFNDNKQNITFRLHHSTLEGFTSMFDRHPKTKRLGERISGFHGLTKIRDCLSRTGEGSECPYVVGDFTPRYLVDGYRWQRKWFHANKSEPDFLVPQKLKLLLPQVKIIMLFRDPTDRLLSSYRYFKFAKHSQKSAIDFHIRAKSQIETWKRCVANVTNIRLCMFDYVPNLNPPLKRFWDLGSHDQIRYGLYPLYLKEWLKVFPREQFLFIRFEDYASDPIRVLQEDVVPFLGLEPFAQDALHILKTWESEDKVFNVRSQHPEHMMVKTMMMLNKFYAPYKKEMAELLNNNKFLWKN